MNYAIWAAVSTEKQAEKVSLSEQETRCRALASARNWTETAGPYLVPGESRTRWINLRDAEEAIPSLREMLNTAQRGAFDLLLLYDFTRLRELLDPVSRTLSAYGVQLYSLAQPVEPVEPGSFDAYASDSSNILQTVSALTSRSEINALRRRYMLGMPRRVTQRGLHPLGKLPYGYRAAPGHEYDNSTPAVPDPVNSLRVIDIKDQYLAGRSLHQIAADLTARNIPTPKNKRVWSISSLHYILKNPYYAGIVSFGRQRQVRDPRTGQIRQETGQPIQAQGLHQSLWDIATHRRIMSELKHRFRKTAGKHTQRFSNLLHCQCGQVCWVGYSNNKSRRYHCSSSKCVQPGHDIHYERTITPLIAARIQHDLGSYQNISLPAPTNNIQPLQAALAGLRERHTNLTDALELGTLDAVTYGQRIEPLNDQIRQLSDQLAELEDRMLHRAEQIDTLQQTAALIAATPEYIQNAPAQEVNTVLRAIIERIIVSGNEINIEWK